MKNKFKIFYVASEVTPFAGKGPLAETASALPKALKEMDHDIRVMMPNYRSVNERKYVLRDVIRLKDMSIKLAQEAFIANGKSAFLPDAKVQIYFFDHKPFFDRLGLYADPKSKKIYADNAERFSLFGKGCLETLKMLHWQPDIIHCNDWQSALIPVLLKTTHKDDPFFKNTKVVVTVHNFVEQGIFPSAILKALDLTETTHYPESPIALDGKFNFLKAGLLSADLISTVGEAHAKQIQQHPNLARGLADILQKKRRLFTGVSHAVDTTVWNPAADGHVPHHFAPNDLSGKLRCKKEFLESVACKFEEGVPLLVLFEPPAAELSDKLETIVAEALAMNVQVVFLGEPGAKSEKALAKYKKKYAGRFAGQFGYDEAFLHRACAAADVIFSAACPSLPVSHVLSAMQYGALPVIAANSGYTEAVQDYRKPAGANGFVLPGCEAKDVIKTLKNAVSLFHDKKRWAKMAKNAMTANRSWESVAETYTKLYAQLMGRGKK